MQWIPEYTSETLRRVSVIFYLHSCCFSVPLSCSHFSVVQYTLTIPVSPGGRTYCPGECRNLPHYATRFKQTNDRRKWDSQSHKPNIRRRRANRTLVPTVVNLLDTQEYTYESSRQSCISLLPALDRVRLMHPGHLRVAPPLNLIAAAARRWVSLR